MSIKMRRVWSDQAREHIRNLRDFYILLNPAFAKYLVKMIFESTKILEQFPEIAPTELQLENENIAFRSLVIMKGRLNVIYFIEENNINILAVLDCRQDLKGKIFL